jgi:hypothetical protein
LLERFAEVSGEQTHLQTKTFFEARCPNPGENHGGHEAVGDAMAEPALLKNLFPRASNLRPAAGSPVSRHP